MPTALDYRQASQRVPPPNPLAAGSSRQDVCWEEWGACGDLSQPLLVTGAAGGLNLIQDTSKTMGPANSLGSEPGWRVCRGLCHAGEVLGLLEGGEWGGLLRLSFLPHQFIARSAEIGNPRGFRPQQNYQRSFSFDPHGTVGLRGRVQAIAIGGGNGGAITGPPTPGWDPTKTGCRPALAWTPVRTVSSQPPPGSFPDAHVRVVTSAWSFRRPLASPTSRVLRGCMKQGLPLSYFLFIFPAPGRVP